MPEATAYPMPPADLVDRLLSLPDYQRQGTWIACAAIDFSPIALMYLDAPDMGQCAAVGCLPLLYQGVWALWVATDLEPTIDEPPQRVLCLTPIGATDLVAVVTAQTLILMRRRDIERQIDIKPTLQALRHTPRRAAR